MKLLPKTDTHLSFQLDELETQLLTLTLSAYPMGHEPWSRPPSPGEHPNQRKRPGSPDPELLAASLSEVKAEHRGRLETFLKGPGVELKSDGGSLLRIPREDVEWFLQVVNEIRIASWYRLDCPDEASETLLGKDPSQLHDLLRMDFAGMMLEGMLRSLEAGTE